MLSGILFEQDGVNVSKEHKGENCFSAGILRDDIETKSTTVENYCRKVVSNLVGKSRQQSF